jgi:hypothetical protein
MVAWETELLLLLHVNAFVICLPFVSKLKLHVNMERQNFDILLRCFVLFLFFAPKLFLRLPLKSAYWTYEVIIL